MIISHGRKYVFVHIPKTGGTSMALALESRAMKDDIMMGDTPKALKRRRRLKNTQARGRLWKHSTLSDIDGMVSVADLEQLFCFTMVRNPWDRAVSYYHWLGQQSFDHPAVRRAKGLDFAGFVNDRATQAGFRDWPATRYMQDVLGREHCAAYIRLEHFDCDVAPLSAHLGYDVQLPVTNVSPRDAQYQRYYTPHLRDVIAACCAEDIAKFGYSFE